MTLTARFISGGGDSIANKIDHVLGQGNLEPSLAQFLDELKEQANEYWRLSERALKTRTAFSEDEFSALTEEVAASRNWRTDLIKPR